MNSTKLVTYSLLRTTVLGVICLVPECSTVVAADEAAAYFDETQAVTLFAFDDVSIPFTQNLKLVMNSPQKHPANPVVQRGPAGAPDSWAVQFYGSVIREGDTFRMWYVAAGDDRKDENLPRSAPWRVAYAESKDGVHWTKPNLGLVEYMGNRNNNIVLQEPHLGTLNVKVLLDPDDPDPQRRYKMGAHVWFPKNDRRLGTLAPYASPDGLRWTLLVDSKAIEAEMQPDETVIPPLHFEPVGGLYKWDGLFYLSGQNAIVAPRPYHGRVTREFVSPDFVHWSQSSALGNVRTIQHTLLGPGRSREGEQIHEGVSVWNRNNVLLGISGIWHGAEEWKDVTIDLGFVLSNDGVYFRQALHEWTFLERGKDDEWDQGGLLQAQGFENVGEQTFVYYGAWDPRNWEQSPPRGGVGIATLPRDRFAQLVVDERTQGPGDYQMKETVSSLMTTSIGVNPDEPHRFFVNADGLSDDASIRVEILGHDTLPLPQFSGKNAAIVRQSGFQTPLTWNDIDELPDRIRLQVTFEGPKKTDIAFSAVYMQ